MEAAERQKLEDEIRTKQEEVSRIQQEVETKDTETRRLQEEVEEARRKQVRASYCYYFLKKNICFLCLCRFLTMHIIHYAILYYNMA